MKIGTRSLLFGIHQVILHPFFVALGWWKLYGFPFDPRLWAAFFVHDLGYFGKPNMDGPEGEQHPLAGAAIMGWLFDTKSMVPTPSLAGRTLGRLLEWAFGKGDSITGTMTWRHFTLYHSRYMARRHHAPFSRLCVADKYAVILVPRWLYLLSTRLTGEIHEYMALAPTRNLTGSPDGTFDMPSQGTTDMVVWHRTLSNFMRKWVKDHRDLSQDNWLPAE